MLDISDPYRARKFRINIDENSFKIHHIHFISPDYLAISLNEFVALCEIDTEQL